MKDRASVQHTKAAEAAQMHACCAKNCTGILTFEPKKPGAWALSSAHFAAAGSCLITVVMPTFMTNITRDKVHAKVL